MKLEGHCPLPKSAYDHTYSNISTYHLIISSLSFDDVAIQFVTKVNPITKTVTIVIIMWSCEGYSPLLGQFLPPRF